MKTILFNIHDFILLLTASISIFIAALCSFRHQMKPVTRNLLICFFTLNAIIALDTLLFWGEAVRYRVFDFFPYFSLIFSFAIFSVGPTLYWYTRSQITADYTWKPRELLHLLPAIAAPIYLYVVCFRFPPAVQRELLLELQIYTLPGPHYAWFITLKKILPVIYAVLSAALVFRRNSRQLQASDQQLTWIKLLVYGFLLVWLWALFTHVFGRQHPGSLSDLMGISGNYMTFFLITALAVYQQVHLTKKLELVEKIAEEIDDSEEEINPEHRDRVQLIMNTEKPFLNPRLTLERFAELVHLPPRQVSLIINRCFEQNFHEYINRYRVEEAKKMLADPEYSIQKIAQLSGFNSKATFNRLFKNLVTVTPSEYREQYSSTQNRPPQNAK